MMSSYNFEYVTLLITHYNRSQSLERLLKAFRDLQISFGGVVVSDDGSQPEHLEKLRSFANEYNFKLVEAAKNGGLGNNINKGQDAVKTPYTLYVQEDFVPTGIFAEHFTDALEMLNENSTFDLVRFYAYFKYPVLKPFKKGFSEMVYKSWNTDHIKFYYYSDHPHLRRSNFFEKFGRYIEGASGDKTEFSMCLSFLKNGGKGLFYNQFSDLFYHINTNDEPSMIHQDNWRTSETTAVRLLRSAYLKFRFLKNTLQLMAWPKQLKN